MQTNGAIFFVFAGAAGPKRKANFALREQKKPHAEREV
jgi:hypothetical protein